MKERPLYARLLQLRERQRREAEALADELFEVVLEVRRRDMELHVEQSVARYLEEQVAAVPAEIEDDDERADRIVYDLAAAIHCARVGEYVGAGIFLGLCVAATRVGRDLPRVRELCKAVRDAVYESQRVAVAAQKEQRPCTQRPSK